jgi:hypothetical protein
MNNTTNNDGGKIMPFARPKSEVEPTLEKTQMETKVLSLAEMYNWQLPPFQRDEVQTKKVIELADELKCNGGMVSGVILLGMMRSKEQSSLPAVIYLVDGQQRRCACGLSGLEEFIADVSLKFYDSMADMAEDFKRVNSRLVPLRPDDLLRAYEITNINLNKLREDCPFVGYGNIRRCDRDPILSMSVVLKGWFGSGLPTPGQQSQAVQLVERFDDNQRQLLTVFLLAAHTAWGSDRQYHRLWSNLNLVMCMYLYRKLVLEPNPRRPPLPIEMFRKCLMSVSANTSYCDWLQGRSISERDRSPCYRRLKTIFADRLAIEYHGKIFKLPKPEWQVS